MMPKVRRKEKSRATSGGFPGVTDSAQAASSHPIEGPPTGATDWGPPEGAPHGAPQGAEALEGDAPRSSRRRSRRLRDRSPPDYSADEILSLVTAQRHHHPQQQQQQQQEQQQRQQQRQKRRAVPRSVSSSKPSSRRNRHDASREAAPLHSEVAVVPLNLSGGSGKHEGRGPPRGATSYHGQSASSSSSSLRALGMGAASAAARAAAATAAAAATDDEPCVLVPLKQARALLASASPAAVQMAAAAAAAGGGAQLSRDPLPHDGFSVGGGGPHWGGGPPRLESLPPEGPPHASTPLPEVLSFGGTAPHKSTHPFRHASLPLTSLPASRPPFLNGGVGFLEHPRAPFLSHGTSAQRPPYHEGPHGGAPRGPHQASSTTDPRAFPLPQHSWDQLGRGPRGRPLEASDLAGPLDSLHGGPPEGPPSHYYRRRSSSSDLPFSSASPLQEMRARRPSLRGPYEYRGPWGAPPRGLSHGGGRGPRTPERFPHHPQPAGEGAPHSLSRRHDEQQRQQVQPFPPRVDARGATVRRLWGGNAAAAVGGPPQAPPPGAAAASLRKHDVERPPTAATVTGREGRGPPTAAPPGGSLEDPLTRGPPEPPPPEAPLLLSRQGAPKGAPAFSRWKEIERQYLRAPAPPMGALRAPPDTPAAAAVLHLENPPSSSLPWQQQGPAAAPSTGAPASAPLPAGFSSEGGPSRTAQTSESLPGPPASASRPAPRSAEATGAPPAGGPSEARRGLPSLSSLAEVLAPTAGSSSGGPLGGPPHPSRAAGGPPTPPTRPKTLSGVFIDAAFPPGAPQVGPLGGAHSRQALSLVATAAAKATLAALRTGVGPPCLRLPWGRHEGAPRGEPSSKRAPHPVREGGPIEILDGPTAPAAREEHLHQPQQEQQEQQQRQQPTLEALRASVAALVETGAPAGGVGPPVQIDAAAVALAAVRLTPAVRVASAAGAAAAATAAAAAAAAAGTAAEAGGGSGSLGDALSAASDFLMKVLAATLDAWLLALSDRQREGIISSRRAEVLGRIAEVAAAVAAEKLQERTSSMRDVAEKVSKENREEAERERRSLLSLQNKETALRLCLLQRAEKWKARFLMLHAGTAKRLEQLAAAEKLLHSLNTSTPALLNETPTRPLDLDDNELRLRLARPRTLKALKEDSLAVAQKTGELQKIKEAALMVQRRHLRKVEAEVVVRTVQATKLLEALGRKRREALSFAALLHRRVMPETDERKVLARLQQCRQGALEPEDPREGSNEGGGPSGGAPRHSSFEGRLSDSSLFTSSYPHPRGERFRFSLSSLLNDPLPPPKDGEEQENQPLVRGEQQQPEGKEVSSGARTPERAAPAAAQNRLQALGRTLEAMSLKKTAATVTGVAAAAAAGATGAAAPAAAAALQTAAATPVRMGLSRHPTTANGFQATFSLRSLVGSRRMR